MADLTAAITRFLGTGSLHHLLAGWNSDRGWRAHTAASKVGGDPWMTVTGHYVGITWHLEGEQPQAASWADIRRLLDRIPAPLVASLAEAVRQWSAWPIPPGQTGASLRHAVDVAEEACWSALVPVDVQLDLFSGLVIA